MIPPPPDPLEEALAHPPALDDGERFTRSVVGRLPDPPGRVRGALLGTGAALAAAAGAALLVHASGAHGAALVAALLALTAGVVAVGEAQAGS